MAEIDILREGARLELVLNRPHKKNALTAAMYRDLSAALTEAAADDRVGVLMFAGAGGLFTAGNDIGDFLAAAQNPEEPQAMGFVRQLARFPKPIVAAVEGLAVGIGCTLLLHCDLVYAAPSARFLLPFVDLGLLPEAGSSLLLPRRVGMARASAWLLAGEGFGAEQAREAGLVNEIVAPEQLREVAREKAEILARKPRAALLATRRFLRGDAQELENRIEEEFAAFRAALASPEAQAAFAAFLNKTK